MPPSQTLTIDQMLPRLSISTLKSAQWLTYDETANIIWNFDKLRGVELSLWWIKCSRGNLVPQAFVILIQCKIRIHSNDPELVPDGYKSPTATRVMVSVSKCGFVPCLIRSAKLEAFHN